MDAVFNMCCGLCRKQGGYDAIPYADVAPATAVGASSSQDYSKFYSSESSALLSPAPAPVAVEPEPAAAPLVAATSVSVGETVTVLALNQCEAAVLGAGMKFNRPRKKRCGTAGVVESIDGIKVKVTFEDEAIDPNTGAVLRVDKANMLFPLAALANAPNAPAPAPTLEEPAAVEASPAKIAPDNIATPRTEALMSVMGGDAGLGPAFTRGEIEPPAGEKTVGSATIGVYTAEQQGRLGVDEAGTKVDSTPAAVAAPPPALAAEPATPAMLGGGGSGLGPAFTRGELEPPAGEKTIGSATIGVYTEEQQARLGVDEEGVKSDTLLVQRDVAAVSVGDTPRDAPAAAAVAPALSDDRDEI